MKKTLSILICIFLLGSVNYSCSKDNEPDTELKVSILDGSGTWNNPFKLSTGKTKANIFAGSSLYVFPYSIGKSYTITLSDFTQDLDLRVVIGYGPNMGTDKTNSVTEGLDDEEITYVFSQADLYLYIENNSDIATDFTISIVEN